MAIDPATGAQLYWLSRLRDLREKEIKDTIHCHVCGKTILLERAIIMEDEVLCEECYQKKYESKKTKVEANPSR